MQEPLFREDARECIHRLSELNLDRGLLIDVVKQAVAARSGVTDNDPASAAGYEAWRASTRRLRELFLPQGWVKSAPKGVECIEHTDLKIRVSMLSTDENTANSNCDPQNRTPKGAGSESATVVNRQLKLPFPHMPVVDQEATADDDFTHWFLCIYDAEDTVLAELSYPTEFSGGRLKHFIERIVILGEGDWNKLDPLIGLEYDSGPEIQISVQRK